MREKFENNILFILIIMCLCVGTFFTVFAKDYDEHYETIFLDNSDKSQIKDISLNKIVIIGDSRMDLLMNDKKVKKPINFIYNVKYGAGFEWFNDEGKRKLEEILDNKDDNYHYHVVLNLGVNDIQSGKTLKKIVKLYTDEYYKFIKKYKNVNFYFLSINPIDEEKLNKSQPDNIRTNALIDKLNGYFRKTTEKYDNYSYCDSNNVLEFLTDDGIHYKSETDQDITDFIVRNCVVYQ